MNPERLEKLGLANWLKRQYEIEVLIHNHFPGRSAERLKFGQESRQATNAGALQILEITIFYLKYRNFALLCRHQVAGLPLFGNKVFFNILTHSCLSRILCIISAG